MCWERYVIKPNEDLLPKNKMKFLVDENIHLGVTDFLRDSGWNVKSVVEAGLSQKSDKDIFQYARKTKRVLLSHDNDFLDVREFPFYKDSCVVILPGAGSSNELIIIEALSVMLDLIAPYRSGYDGSKIEIKESEEIVVIRQEAGKISRRRYKSIDKKFYQWVA